MNQVYLQMYSLGFAAGDLADSFKKIAEIGYHGIEFAGNYGGLSGSEMKKLLIENKLDAISAHVQADNVLTDLPFLAEIGTKYAIVPMYMFETREDVLVFAKRLDQLGEECAKFGLKTGYHNHTEEFKKFGDEYLLEILMANTNPHNVVFELDAGWASAAGIDVVAFINKHAGRFAMIHVKENYKVIGVQEPLFPKVKPGGPPPFKFDENGVPIFPEEIRIKLEERKKINGPAGKGIIDWKAVKEAADAQGCQAYIIEREYDYMNNILSCLKEDFEYLKTV